MLKAYKYRIYPNKQQEEHRKEAYESKKRIFKTSRAEIHQVFSLVNECEQRIYQHKEE